MSDPLILSLTVIVSIVLSAWFTMNQCADAELHGNRLWWRKALFRARQRVEYKEFSRDAEQQRVREVEYAAHQKGEEVKK